MTLGSITVQSIEEQQQYRITLACPEPYTQLRLDTDHIWIFFYFSLSLQLLGFQSCMLLPSKINRNLSCFLLLSSDEHSGSHKQKKVGYLKGLKSCGALVAPRAKAHAKLLRHHWFEASSWPRSHVPFSSPFYVTLHCSHQYTAFIINSTT